MNKFIPLATAATLSVNGFAPVPINATAKTNIIWIMTDEQNTLTMESYDNEYYKHLGKSPNLDRMASEGTLFMEHYIQCPQCVASRTSMLTGLYPHQNGVINNNAYFENWQYSDMTTLPEVFSQNGYLVANFGKTHYPKGKEIWSDINDNSHYSTYTSRYAGDNGLGSLFRGQDARWEVLKIPAVKGELVLSAIYPTPLDGDKYMEEALADKAINWLDTNKDNTKPFMLRVSILSPHAPFYAPEDKYNMFTDEDMANFDKPTADLLSKLPAYEKSNQATDAQNLRINKTYYGLASHVDDVVGRIDQYLKDNGLYENTVVLFTSDHGHLNGEYGQYGKGQYYDLTSRVPTFMKGKGVPIGQRREYFTESVDFGVTLMNAAGITPPPQFLISGIDMLNPARERTEVIGEIALKGVRRSWIRTKDYSMDYNYMNFTGYAPDEVTNDDAAWLTTEFSKRDGKLIDLKSDPLFHNNVYNDENYIKVREMLTKRLEERLKDNAKPIADFYTAEQIAGSKKPPAVNDRTGQMLDFTNIADPFVYGGKTISTYADLADGVIFQKNEILNGDNEIKFKTTPLSNLGTQIFAAMLGFHIRYNSIAPGFSITKNPTNNNDNSMAIRLLDNTYRYSITPWSLNYLGAAVTGLYTPYQNAASTKFGNRMVSVKLGDFSNDDRAIKMSLVIYSAIPEKASDALNGYSECIIFDPSSLKVKFYNGSQMQASDFSYEKGKFYEVKLKINRFDESSKSKLLVDYYVNDTYLGSGEFFDNIVAAGTLNVYACATTTSANQAVISKPEVYIDDFWYSDVPAEGALRSGICNNFVNLPIAASYNGAPVT